MQQWAGWTVLYQEDQVRLQLYNWGGGLDALTAIRFTSAVKVVPKFIDGPNSSPMASRRPRPRRFRPCCY